MAKIKEKEMNDNWPLYKILFIVSIVGIIFYYLSFFFYGFGFLGSRNNYSIFFIRYLSYAFYITFIVAIILFFNRKKEEQKVYKQKEVSTPNKMKIQHIFYTVGVFFIFASVWYFAREFINDLPDPIKLGILIVSVIVTFIIAELLRGSDK